MLYSGVFLEILVEIVFIIYQKCSIHVLLIYLFILKYIALNLHSCIIITIYCAFIYFIVVFYALFTPSQMLHNILHTIQSSVSIQSRFLGKLRSMMLINIIIGFIYYYDCYSMVLMDRQQCHKLHPVYWITLPSPKQLNSSQYDMNIFMIFRRKLQGIALIYRFVVLPSKLAHGINMLPNIVASFICVINTGHLEIYIIMTCIVNIIFVCLRSVVNSVRKASLDAKCLQQH